MKKVISNGFIQAYSAIILTTAICLYGCYHDPNPFADINDYKGSVVLESSNWMSCAKSGVTKTIRKPNGTIIDINLPQNYGNIFMPHDTIK